MRRGEAEGCCCVAVNSILNAEQCGGETKRLRSFLSSNAHWTPHADRGSLSFVVAPPAGVPTLGVFGDF